MEDGQCGREKTVALANWVAFVFAMLIMAFVALATISTKRHFEAVLTEMSSRELPAVTRCIFSVQWAGYAFSFATLSLLLILKEVLIRPQKVKLVVNIAAILGALAYIAIYAYAILSPMLERGR